MPGGTSQFLCGAERPPDLDLGVRSWITVLTVAVLRRSCAGRLLIRRAGWPVLLPNYARGLRAVACLRIGWSRWRIRSMPVWRCSLLDRPSSVVPFGALPWVDRLPNLIPREDQHA